MLIKLILNVKHDDLRTRYQRTFGWSAVPTDALRKSARLCLRVKLRGLRKRKRKGKHAYGMLRRREKVSRELRSQGKGQCAKH